MTTDDIQPDPAPGPAQYPTPAPASGHVPDEPTGRQPVHPAFAAAPRPPREPWINPAKRRVAALLGAAALVLALIVGAVVGAALNGGDDGRGGHGRAYSAQWLHGRPMPRRLGHRRLPVRFRGPAGPGRSTAPPSAGPPSRSASPTPTSSQS